MNNPLQLHRPHPPLITPALLLLLQSLALMLPNDRAIAQVYCGITAETIDPPTNLRSRPASDAPIRCQLRQKGRRLQVYPITATSSTASPRWLATMACERGLAAHPGMGRRPAYVHRSQIRLLAIDRLDWPAAQKPATAQPRPTGCQALWAPYEMPLPSPAIP